MTQPDTDRLTRLVDSLPDVVGRKATLSGCQWWIDGLAGLLADLEQRWEVELEAVLDGGTEAFVAVTKTSDEHPGGAVLKVLVPHGEHVGDEITVLELVDGQGCAQLFRSDREHSALLVERLGPSMNDLGLPFEQRLEILTQLAAQVWRPAPDSGLPTGADKARRLHQMLIEHWDELDQPCSERAVEHALACLDRRASAYDPQRAVLVHGDVHEWNALVAGNGYKLVDPDGLLVEAEYDLGVLMREDPVELMQGEPFERAALLARRTGLDATAIWEWGVVERLCTGLLATKIELQPVAAQMLDAAETIARLHYQPGH